MVDTAILVVLATGCRPKEGAFVVYCRSIQPNNYIVFRKQHKFMATMPATETKTAKEYMWQLPNDFERVVDCILKHSDTGFASYS